MFKSGTYICLLLIILLSARVDVCSAKVSRGQLESVEEQAQIKAMEHKKKQAEAIALSLELAKLNKEMINAAKQLQVDEDKTTEMEKNLEDLEKQLEVLETDFAKEYKNLSHLLFALQNLALYPTETLVVQPLSPVEIIQSAILMRESVPHIKKNADKLEQDLKKINDQKKQVELVINKLNKQKESLIDKQNEMKQMADKKSAIRKKIEGESLALKNQADRLASQAEDLKELVEKLEKDEELSRRRKEEIRKAAKRREQEALKKLEEEQLQRIKERKSKGLTSEDGKIYLDNSVDVLESVNPQQISQSLSDFASAKGQLTRPARGEIITSYGQELSKGVSSKGIVIKTRELAQIIAPFDGSVIFSGPFKGYGNLIIIDHGKGYVSLLAGLGSSDTQIGQMLLAGEPVGIMPDSDMAKLYMEIRKDQHPINPEPWLEK